jgi:GNAT superfamily N-acetyltransferase
MDDATLARLEHQNMLEWLRVSCAQVPGAIVRVGDGLGVFSTGLPAPIFNQVVTDDGATDGDVAAAVELLRTRGAPFCLVLRRGADARFRTLARRLSLGHDDEILPGMALHPIPDDLRTTADGLDIRVVGDAASLRDHAIVAGRGFGIPESMALAFVGEELWLRAGATPYVGYADGAPVVSGFSVRSGPTLGVFTIATAPEARGRGFGAAMTSRLVTDGATAGCTVAALQASTMGRPIYERLGFRLVQEYDIYVGRPTPA